MKQLFLTLTLFHCLQAFAQSPSGKYRVLDVYLPGTEDYEPVLTDYLQSMAAKEVQGAIIELDSDSLRMHQPNGTYSASAVISMEGNRVSFNSKENKLNTFDFKKKDNGQWLLIRENDGAFLCEKIE